MIPLLYWKDFVEIGFFSVLFYYAARWLKKDKQKNLLLPFYGYCAICFSAYYLELTTISYTLFLFAPVAAMIFIVVHQEQLQRNLVALRNITPAKRIQLDWLETLIKTSLLAINNGKTITCIIERQDTMNQFLETQLKFNAQLEQGLLEILLASNSFDQERMIWVNTQGQLVGVNVAWRTPSTTIELEQNVQKLPEWKKHALFFTAKTDAIVLNITPTSRTFDLVLNGMIVDRMHATKTLELIKKYVMSKRNLEKGVVFYENVSQKRSVQQRST
jgi:hypothetical protein